MYIPRHFAEDDPAVLHGLMRAHPLACRVVMGGAGLEANHIPLLLDAATGVLRGHVARANPLWRMAVPGLDALAVFQGEQAYITPSWYPAKAEHGKVVPTWNYEAVHVHGRLRAVEDRDWLLRLVSELTDEHESRRAAPWHVGDAPPDYVDGLLGAIVGIELTITRIEGKRKLSQNRADADREGVARGLDEDGATAAAARMQAPHQT